LRGALAVRLSLTIPLGTCDETYSFAGKFYSLDELTNQIDLFVDHYNNDRYHEALNNLTPADVYHGRDREILSRRRRIKKETMVQRRRHNYSRKVA